MSATSSTSAAQAQRKYEHSNEKRINKEEEEEEEGGGGKLDLISTKEIVYLSCEIISKFINFAPPLSSF